MQCNELTYAMNESMRNLELQDALQIYTYILDPIGSSSQLHQQILYAGGICQNRLIPVTKLVSSSIALEGLLASS